MFYTSTATDKFNVCVKVGRMHREGCHSFAGGSIERGLSLAIMKYSERGAAKKLVK